MPSATCVRDAEGALAELGVAAGMGAFMDCPWRAAGGGVTPGEGVGAGADTGSSVFGAAAWAAGGLAARSEARTMLTTLLVTVVFIGSDGLYRYDKHCSNFTSANATEAAVFSTACSAGRIVGLPTNSKGGVSAPFCQSQLPIWLQRHAFLTLAISDDDVVLADLGHPA